MHINNNQQRRWSPSWKRSWCRMPTNQALFNHKPFYTSSVPKVDGPTRKIFMRSFKNRGLCRIFMSKLNKRFTRRFGRPVKFRINLRGRKIEYYDRGINLA